MNCLFDLLFEFRLNLDRFAYRFRRLRRVSFQRSWRPYKRIDFDCMIIVVVHTSNLERVFVSTRWPVKENNITKQGKLHSWPYCTHYFKLFKFCFKLLLHAYLYSSNLNPCFKLYSYSLFHCIAKYCRYGPYGEPFRMWYIYWR